MGAGVIEEESDENMDEYQKKKKNFEKLVKWGKDKMKRN